MTRIKYQYQVIRFVPDRIREEFVNVGIVMYIPEQNYLKAYVVDKYGRISQFFGEVNGSYLLKVLQFMKKKIESIAEKMNDELQLEHPSNLSSITNSILPKDDSALMFTEVNYGLNLDPDKAFTNLKERYLPKQKEDASEHRYSDKQVWSKIYKRYFEQKGIADKLQKRTARTRTDNLEFDLAYKNGNWNYLEPVNFDLKSMDAFREKVFKLIGKADALGTASNEVDYHLLTHLTNHRSQLQEYLEEKLKNRTFGRARLHLVTESDIEEFVQNVERDLKHQNNNTG